MLKPEPPPSPDHLFSTEDLHDNLRGRSIRGGSVTLTAQGCRFALQMLSTVILARLLTPKDFGLVAMVASITGFVELFMDLGLSMATVQREHVTHDQVTTLFWINVAVGLGLMLLTTALSPAVAWFYQEPSLVEITIALSTGFLVSAVGVQHQALLRRRMRFTTVAIIEVISNLLATGAAVATALLGAGVWSLVVQRLVASVTTSVGVWTAAGWRPSLRFGAPGVRSMLLMGTNLAGFNTFNYLARSADGVLIGRWWGPGELGLYGRALQLLLLPLQQINQPLTNVAILSLSRLQNEPERMRSFYLRALSLGTAVTMPMVVLMTLLSDEIVEIVLGPQWREASHLFRLLAPALLVMPVCNTVGWIYIATGRTDRMFRWGIVYSTLMVTAFAIGVRFGAAGVAAGYSTAMVLQTFPCLWYALRGTPIRLREVARSVMQPAIAAAIAGAATLLLTQFSDIRLQIWGRAGASSACFTLVYAIMLLGAFHQWPRYRDIIVELRRR